MGIHPSSVFERRGGSSRRETIAMVSNIVNDIERDSTDVWVR